MTYKILYTDIFIKWFESLKDRKVIQRISDRIDRIIDGNFGDSKIISTNLYELRFFFCGGIRIYYTKEKDVIILLLCGGNKSTQAHDIKKAKELLRIRENENE